jgi:hypothetical protein
MQKANGKQKQRPPRRKKAKASIPNGGLNTSNQKKMVHIGRPASDYARCLVDPKSGPQAKIPNMPVLLSKSFRTKTYGQMATGTLGFGFIACDPFSGVVSDRANVIYSDAAFAGASMNFLAGAGVNTSTSNSEYLQAQVGGDDAQFEYRPVGCELRIRYSGTELNRGGTMVALHDANHNSLYLETYSTMLEDESAARFTVKDEKWTKVLYRPTDETDVQFLSTFPTYTPATTDKSYFMGVAVVAPSAVTPATFDFEVNTCYEIWGRKIRGMTPSWSDAVGFQSAHAVSNISGLFRPRSEISETNEVGQREVVKAMAQDVHFNSTHVSSGESRSQHEKGMAQNIGEGIVNSGLLGLLDFFF